METGTVSHATMRTQDLVPAFLSVLKEEDEALWAELIEGIDDYEAMTENDDDPRWYEDGMVGFLYEDLWDAMNDIAPEGYYFGAHPGDGSDYGFWEYDDDWM